MQYWFSTYKNFGILSLVLLFSGIKAADTAYYFDYNDEIKLAYDEIIMLNFNSGQTLLAELSKAQPHNLAVTHIANYIDFLTLFINEDQEQFELRYQNKETRLDKINNAADDDPNKEFARAEILLQWALIRSKFGELTGSAKDIYQATRILEKAKLQHPEFLLYNKSLSVIHALAESIPLPSMVKSMFGISGTIEQSLVEIKTLVKRSHKIFHLEAEAIYTFILHYQANDPDKAWSVYLDSDLASDKSPLARFIGIKLAQRSGRNDAALNLLEQIEIRQYQEFPYLYFLKGLSQLRKLDPEAKQSFEAYLSNFNGKHYIKEAYQKIGWYELVIQENHARYLSNMLKCKQEGHALIDDDKQALKEAEKGLPPHPDLLRARLLYDGGYYQKAQQFLIVKGHIFYFDEAHRAEYLYRLGRISQALLNYADALQYYGALMGDTAYTTSFYTCNAALQSGVIYESQKNYNRARSLFNKCLELQPTEYSASLHQKAKSGLNRIKNR